MSETREATMGHGVEEILSPQPLSYPCINKLLAEIDKQGIDGYLSDEEKVYMCMIPAAEYGVTLERRVEVELPDEVVKGWKEGRFKLLFVKV